MYHMSSSAAMLDGARDTRKVVFLLCNISATEEGHVHAQWIMIVVGGTLEIGVSIAQ